MSTRFGSCVLVAASCWVCAATANVAAAKEPAQLGPPEQIALTLYSDGRALVRESRRATLTRGRNHVIVTKLPAGLDATSIRVEGDGVTLVEVRDGIANLPYQRERDREQNPRAGIRTPQGEVVGEWVLEAERPTKDAVTVSYLVPGIQYSASLDVVFDEQGGTELDGWIAIQNRTGIRYAEASIVFVTAPARKTATVPPQGTQVQRREVPLADPVTIEPGQGRRFLVLSRRPELEPERTVIEGGRVREHDERLPPSQKLTRKDLGTEPVHAEVRRRLGANDVAAVARVLPPLVRRVYWKGRNGSELLYEDQIDPVGMSPEVTVKRTEDLRVERRQLQFTRREDPTASEETIEIVVANDGARPARVELVENLFRSPNFEIQSSSRDLDVGNDFGRNVATTALTIAAGKQMKLTYTVVYRP